MDQRRRALIIATGPSLTQSDVDEAWLLDRYVIAVNDAYKLAPWADALYACDYEWWEHHKDNVPRGMVCYTWSDRAAREFGLNHIEGRSTLDVGVHFSTAPGWIVTGGNSGFQAINLAYLLGARDIVLLGFDMGHDKSDKSHFFGDHPPSLYKASPYRDWIKHFNAAAPEIAAAGVRIVNASRRTALDCFPRCTISECD